MSSPIVTIIVPTYNYGHLINQTLECILNQSFEEWEAIIVDDGSTDHTREVVGGFVKRDRRFHYFYQSNSGVSKARNTALHSARGRFIQFLDADDLVSKDKLALQIKYLYDNPDIDVVNVNTRYFHTDNPDVLYTDLNLTNASKREQVKGKGLDPVLELVEHNPIVVQGPVFKRSILRHVPNFAENMKYLEDWDFWVRIALSNYRFDHIDHPDAVSLVRVHAISASQNGSKIQEGEGFFRKRLTSLIKNALYLTEIQKKAAINLNARELKNTYKDLMAKTNLSDLKKFKDYYLQLGNALIFLSCYLKALNIKRKKSTGRS